MSYKNLNALKKWLKTNHDHAVRLWQSDNHDARIIGTRSDFLEEQALAAAHEIGKVEVDHDETSCETPDAISYIPKAREHRRKKERKKA